LEIRRIEDEELPKQALRIAVVNTVAQGLQLARGGRLAISETQQKKIEYWAVSALKGDGFKNVTLATRPESLRRVYQPSVIYHSSNVQPGMLSKIEALLGTCPGGAQPERIECGRHGLTAAGREACGSKDFDVRIFLGYECRGATDL